jgi:hypothetical protein
MSDNLPSALRFDHDGNACETGVNPGKSPGILPEKRRDRRSSQFYASGHLAMGIPLVVAPSEDLLTRCR